MHDRVIVPSGDVLIHAGDATYRGLEKEVKNFGRWFRQLPHQHKIFVAGNHDRVFEDDPIKARKWFFEEPVLNELGTTYYLQDSGCNVKVGDLEIGIWGSPWQLFFCDWAFNLRTEEELNIYWDMIPVTGIDILVVHGPPNGLTDLVQRGENVGSTTLRKRIEEIKPKLVVCGHIHEDYKVIKFGETFIANSSICSLYYHPVNKPHIFTYDGIVMKEAVG